MVCSICISGPLWSVFDHCESDFYSCNYLSSQLTLKFIHAILSEFTGIHSSLQIFYKSLFVGEKLLKQEMTRNDTKLTNIFFIIQEHSRTFFAAQRNNITNTDIHDNNFGNCLCFLVPY